MRCRCAFASLFLLLTFVDLVSAQNRVQAENALPGTTGWQLSNPAINREIEGYGSLTSVNVGSPISFFVSTSDTTFNLDIFRTGYYNGVGARLQTSVPNLPGTLQATPTPDPNTGLVECQWTKNYTLTVPTTWTSGIFLARLTGNQSGKQSYIIFVVRDDLRPSKILFEQSVTTFEAYNFWPGGATGKSLYNWAPGGRAWKVSFNRPYVLGASYTTASTEAGSGLGAGEYLANLQPGYQTGYPIPAAGFEYNMVRWLEQNGYDVTYITNIDLHESTTILSSHSAFLSVGHNEYWSMPMLNNVQSASANGLNVGYFSANTQYWQVRLEPGADGTSDRTIVCYKYDAASNDPLYNSNPQLATVEFRQAPINLPEAARVGVEYVGDPFTGDMVISNASHWLMNGTGLNNGDHLTGLLGYEVDAYVPGLSPSNTSILATSPVGPFGSDTDNPPGFSCDVNVCNSNMVWYSTGHSFVFATGSMFWPWGLDDYGTPALRPSYLSAAAKQITINVLASFITPVAVATTSLPAGKVNTAYSPVSLGANGGGQPYTWTATGLPAGLTLSSNGVLSGTPTAVGSSSVNVTVTDGAAKTGSATLTLTIGAQGNTVSVVTTAPSSGTVGVPYTQALAATGGTPPYTWSVTSGALPAGISLSVNGTLSGTPTAAGTSTFTVQVKGADGSSVSKQLQLTINAPLSITTSSLPTAVVGSAYAQTPNASGGSPPYQWSIVSGALPGGLALSGTSGAITGTPSASGSFSFTLTVTDSTSLTTTAALTITVNAALSVSTSALSTGAAGVAYSQALTATGGIGPYQWSLSTGTLPAGVSLTSAGVITGTPTSSGSFAVTVQVKDNTGAVASRPLTVLINPALAIASTTLGGGSVSTPYSQTLSATGGLSPYTWSLASGTLPAGIALNASSGALTGTPTAMGVYGLTVKVVDSSNQSATQALQILITGPLTVTTTTLPAGAVGGPYSQTLAATGGTTPYQWSTASGTLPPGLVLSTSGTIAGTASSAGSFSVVVQVKDSNNQVASQSLSLTVNAGLTITTASLPSSVANSPYSQTLASTGGTPPYQWSVTTGVLPAGLSLSPGGVLAGTATAAGSFTFTVQSKDATSDTVSRAFTLVINPALTVTNTTLSAGTGGVAYTQTLGASGGTSPYTWSVLSGTLPSGVSLSAAGVLSGTPATAGSYSFTVQVRDSNGASASQAFSLLINAPLVITASTLPGSTTGMAYSQTLSASGGTSPYQWSITSGTLPSGLTLNSTGVLAGTPTVSGSFTFTVQVLDSKGQTASQALQLLVTSSVPTGITTGSLAPAFVGVPYVQALAATGGVAPYVWSVAGGSLPAGLTLGSNGAFSGSALTAGTFALTIQAKDANAQTASAALTLKVAGLLDPFLAGSVNATLWCQCVLDQGTGSQNAAVALTQANGQLKIQPLSNTGGLNYNGYNLLRSLNMSDAALSVEAVQTTVGNGSTDTSFVLAVDSSNWYRFIVEGGQLYFQAMTAGTKSGVSTPYNPSAQLYWRFRHSSAANQMIYETSADGVAWTQGWQVAPAVPVTALTAGVNAGSWSPDPSPGQAIFANFRWETTSTAAFPNVPSPPALPNAQVNAAYSQTLQEAGGTAPLQWSVVSGVLPGGLSLSAAGVISGTPTASGTFLMAAQVTDSNGLAAIQTLQMIIGAGLNISTSSLPGATVGSAYSQALAVSGGTAPYTWSVVSGTLPAGLALNTGGLLAGTPSAPGIATFTVQVRDVNSLTATQALTLTVSAAATYSITGTVTNGSSALAGVQMTLSNGAATATSGTGGFSFGGLTNQTYTVTPALSGYTFSPASLTFTSLSANQTANFTAAAVGVTLRAISIDFVGGGTPMAASETAGVVAKSNWNSAAGNVRTTPLSLVDEMGATTGATITWNADNNWRLPVADAPGNVRMMIGYLDTGAQNPTTVSVNGLAASPTGYDVYVYTDGDNAGSTNTASYSLSGAGFTTVSTNCIDPANTNFGGAFNSCTPGPGNFIKFSIKATAFTLTATPLTAADGNLRAEVNGIQIVPTPAVVTTYSISGTVTNGGAGLSGVTLTLNNGATTTSAANGSFTFSGLPPATYTVAPTLANYTFTPASQTFSNITANQTASFAATAAPAVRAISIDFVGNGVAMLPNEAAGVIAKTNWNSASGNVRTTPLALVDETGAATAASVIWTADNGWSLPIADAPGNTRMMVGYLDTGAQNPTTVKVSGLPVSPTGYDVYVYTDGDNATSSNTSRYTLSGTGITSTAVKVTDSANTNFSGTFRQATGAAGNYVKFTITATAFTLTATPLTAADGALRAEVNGIQILPH